MRAATPEEMMMRHDKVIDGNITPLVYIGVIVFLLALSGCGRSESDSAKLNLTHSISGATGFELFNSKCSQCHALKVSIGPSLQGVFNRKSGSVRGFEYTEELKDSEIKWDRESLIQLMLDPQKIVPGINMIESKLDRESAELIVNYLESL